MHTSTLRGVFPDPKPVYRRNFIKENVKSIKQMQGMLQEAGYIQPKASSSCYQERYNSVPRRAEEKTHTIARPNRSDNRNLTEKSRMKSEVQAASPHKIVKQAIKLCSKKENTVNTTEPEQKVTHRSMQTERTDNLTKLYETGVIKYPRAGIVKDNEKKSPVKALTGQGDAGDDIAQDMQNLDIDKQKDFISQNKYNLKPKTAKQVTPKVLANAPETYQRGVIPKYLRDKKEDDGKEEQPDVDCPPGHILLPEEERKETLRVLRQSYADRIQELNMMPVRNDTLRMRKRKMEIEEELKRIDGGIKVFQRPKVFVKIDA